MIKATYIINVESKLDRRKYAMNQAKQYDLPSSRVIKATTPADKVVKRIRSNRLSPAEIACKISHIRIWRRIAHTRSHDFVLVMEDDAYCMVPKKKALSIMNHLAATAPKQINFINLGGRCKEQPRNKLKGTSSLYQYDTPLYHCYLIRRSASAKWANLAYLSDKCIDKVHQISLLKNEYAVYVYKGKLGNLTLPDTCRHLKSGIGIFGQLRGKSFSSDIKAGRKSMKQMKY